jgi:hypothetical protein
MREVVVNEAAYVLAEAGLFEDSDALLTAELARSRTPYYHMLGLAANAKKRGDKAAAVAWTEKAYGAASGPATWLQWGVSYVNTLIDLAPDDAARIERAAIQVIDELEPDPDTFCDRNAGRSGGTLAWNRERARRRLRRVFAQLAGSAQLPPATPLDCVRRRLESAEGRARLAARAWEQGPREQSEWGCDRRRVDARGRQRNCRYS